MKTNLKRKGLFILHEGINTTMFNSQVLEHVSKMNDQDFDFEILSFNTEDSFDKKYKYLLSICFYFSCVSVNRFFKEK